MCEEYMPQSWAFAAGSPICLKQTQEQDLSTPATTATLPASQELWESSACPDLLQGSFGTTDIQSWEPGRFRLERTVRLAPRNRGRVDWMVDTVDSIAVAVKVMPNEWVCDSEADFRRCHTGEIERPWVDIACNAFLNNVEFPYACPLRGVFLDLDSTYVVSELATCGDLFSWAVSCEQAPGVGREELVLPLARQLFDSIRWLHDLQIVHHDVSVENILVNRFPDGDLRIQLIDFGMALTSRFTDDATKRGKRANRAPEVYSEKECDGFLCDTFAAGVTIYAVLLGEYPWVSTEPGACKVFDFTRVYGFRALAEKRKLCKGRGPLVKNVSGPLLELLMGLLAIEPSERLTLGENVWVSNLGRKSVWEEPW
eukprot:CAMPEP_0171072004 /NCGR_PEP_ID=MMETSP0766_2-20121228/10618_1 /TAXON_ID=439317 /ORGANISM="Gambierdiscus australes, Strain CAWD 149" /LENGTH=369 /DNA_ID=CAMNT_0011528563 /DNA_START=35 /DNA_END=1141 /DNA_ORIENTATION=+